jgi:hypothetical protein
MRCALGRRSGLVRRFGGDGERDSMRTAEKEERDRRRAEARRYPVEDGELLAELREAALQTGARIIAPSALLPCPCRCQEAARGGCAERCAAPASMHALHLLPWHAWQVPVVRSGAALGLAHWPGSIAHGPYAC